jgi:predicted permease
MLRRMLHGEASRDELSEEVSAFLEHDIESKIRSGMTPRDARRAALIELGGADRVKERVWDNAAGARWESAFRDLYYALRSLGQARAFSASVIGSLSLGLAATIMAFALINGALLPRTLPGVQDTDRLVTLGILREVFGPGGSQFRLRRTTWSDYPDVVSSLEGMTSLEQVASFTESEMVVTLPQPVSLRSAFVSPDYFDVLGVRPEIGRAFAPNEGGADAAVAIIGHGLWTGEFGGDPGVIGAPIQVGGQPFQIIGVAPQGFTGTSQGAGVELWVPIAFVESLASNSRDEYRIGYLGRIRDGTDIDRVEIELGVIAPGIAASATNPADSVRVEVSPVNESDGFDVLEAASLLGVPFLVLAIGCVNAANLMLVRSMRRAREVAIRLALGASRLRLVRLLVTESLILALGATLLALPLASSGMRVLAAIIGYSFATPLDGTVVAGAVVTAFLTALAFGLVPALRSTSQNPSAALGTAHAGSGGTRGHSRGRVVLVAGQVALSLGLVGTTFQLTSALEQASIPPTDSPDRLLLASFNLEATGYSSAEIEAFYFALLDGASRLPGVEAAALSDRDLTDGWADSPPAVGVSGSPDSLGGFVLSGYAGGDYFDVLGLELVRGREFDATDRRDTPETAIVTERLAALYGGAAEALDRSVYVSNIADTPGRTVLRIVGVVESPVAPSGEGVAAIFFPYPVLQGTSLTLYLRATGPAAPLAPVVRDLVSRLDSGVPILHLGTLEQMFGAANLDELNLARVAALIGIATVLLASLGLYGVTSYSVAVRAREIAVRMALGARSGSVQTMILRQALFIALIGSVIGGVAATAIGALIRAEIVDVASVDVQALSLSAACLAVAMLFASFVPARRAARLDPYSVLREE